MKKLILMICLILPNISYAGNFELYLASKHFNLETMAIDNSLNGSNPGIGYNWKDNSIGCYYNSYKKESCYIAKNYGLIRYGLITGYDQSKIMIALHKKIGRVNLYIIPGYELAFGLSITL